MRRHLCVCAAAGIMTTLGGCGWFETSSADRGSSATVSVTFHKDQFERDKEAFRRQADERLHEFDAHLKELQAKAATAGGEAKANLDFEMAKHRLNLEQARIELRDIDAVAGEKWAEFKKRSSAALDDLKKGLDQAASRFK